MKKELFNLTFCFLGFTGFVKAGQPLEKQPNILIAVADDASWKHFGAYGCDWVKTPGFDYVAQKGILFANTYTPNAKSAPSRSCMLTGRNSWQLEEAANHSPCFPAKFKTYAEVLAENGYHVGNTGKDWAPGDPGTVNGKRRELIGKPYNEKKLNPPAKYISDNDYLRNFEAFLKDNPEGKPFCFWYGSFEPHRPYEYGTGVSSGKKRGAIPSIPSFWPDVDSVRTDLLDYAYVIEYFDAHLLQMIKLLESAGELDNTLIIVTSDNGMPFPRIKGQAYEYSNHLPLAIMWPRGIEQPGKVIDNYVSFIDLAPTFLDVAGIGPSDSGMAEITGRSLTRFFTSGEVAENDESDFVLIGKERHDVGRPDDQGYPIRGILKGNYLYIRNFETDRWPSGNPETGYLNTDGSPTKSYILNTRRNDSNLFFWSLNFGKRPAEELYDVKNDPYCMTNLSGNPAFLSLKKELSEKMQKELLKQTDPRITGNGSVFDHYPYCGEQQNFYNRFLGGEKIPTTWVNESDYEKGIIF